MFVDFWPRWDSYFGFLARFGPFRAIPRPGSDSGSSDLRFQHVRRQQVMKYVMFMKFQKMETWNFSKTENNDVLAKNTGSETYLEFKIWISAFNLLFDFLLSPKSRRVMTKTAIFQLGQFLKNNTVYTLSCPMPGLFMAHAWLIQSFYVAHTWPPYGLIYTSGQLKTLWAWNGMEGFSGKTLFVLLPYVYIYIYIYIATWLVHKTCAVSCTWLM